MKAYESGAVCMANSLTCKIPHKKAFFAVLTDEQNSALFSASRKGTHQAAHSLDPRCSPTPKPRATANPSACSNTSASSRDNFVLKPNDEYGGTGVHLGWENSESEWDAALQKRARRDATAPGSSRNASRSAAKFSPCKLRIGIEMRDMLVDFAPYLFRGKMAGCLTRLSSTGLANVTSGGGQVPSFVVEPRP